MCGICGQYNFTTGEPVNPASVRAMADAMVHRGPDDHGYHFSSSLGLGFRRLSIIDLTGGHQPMADSEESVWVVFNGEIYNFPELKSELESYGHVFRTRCDTEVIVHGYKQWNTDVFRHLNGMFGLALWDVRRKRLVLARDGMGIKPLYYRIKNGTLDFGSEIRAVRAADVTSPEIDPVAVNLFLRYRFTPSPFTIYKGIKKLAPGSLLIAENGKCEIRQWYDYKPEPFTKPPSDNEAVDELNHIYKRSIKRHLLSDVPVGLLLSGGLDSGLLLGLMGQSGTDWRTYSIGYGASFRDDELSEAEETAHHFAARHTSIEISRDIFAETLPKAMSFLEEPIAASSIVPMYLVSERARRDVKVALNGQGPDELFGGYRRHLGVRYGKWWGGLPAWVRQPVRAAMVRLPRNETLKRGLSALAEHDRVHRYQQVLSIAPGPTIDGFFHDGLLPQHAGDLILDCWKDLIPLMEHTDELGGLQLLEVRSTLPDELLMYADKLSMAHSLEVRVPYLDREIVEYVQRLGATFKVRNGRGKWLHRRVSQRYLPRTIRRRKKRGFAVNVVDDWFQRSLNGPWKDFLVSSDSLMFRHLRRDAVLQLMRDHQASVNDNHKLLFSFVAFEQFLRNL